MSQIVLRSLALQSDGKAVAVGFQRNGAADYYVTRFNVDGSIDTSFGNGGSILTSLCAGEK